MTTDYFQLLKDTEEFWQSCVKKTRKLYMQRAYREAREAGATREAILKGMEEFKAHVYREGIAAIYIPAPDKWLEAGQWMDEYERPMTKAEEQEIKRKYSQPQQVSASISPFERDKLARTAL